MGASVSQSNGKSNKPPRMQARKQEFVRDAIWHAAIGLFVEKGFDETTIEDIAEDAGVSRRTFFRYFSSKNDLMGQGIVSYGTVLTEAIAACPNTAPLIDVVHATVLQVATGAAAHPLARKVIRIADRYTAAREAQLSRMAEVERRVTEAFALRCESADDVTPKLLASMTLSILDVTFRLWFDREEEDISSTAEEVFTSLTRLVAGDPAPAGRRKAATQNRR